MSQSQTTERQTERGASSDGYSTILHANLKMCASKVFQILYHRPEICYFLCSEILCILLLRLTVGTLEKQNNLCSVWNEMQMSPTSPTTNSLHLKSPHAALSPPPPQPSLSGPGSSRWRLPPTPTSTAAEEASTRTARRCPSGEAAANQRRSKCDTRSFKRLGN